METRPFRVDSRIIPPVVLAVAFGCLLLVLEGPTSRGILLAALLAPFFYLAGEILARRIVVDEKGITVLKLLRSVHYDWPEISSVDSVRAGSKLFLVLYSDEGSFWPARRDSTELGSASQRRPGRTGAPL
jgi:hypothetical protein